MNKIKIVDRIKKKGVGREKVSIKFILYTIISLFIISSMTFPGCTTSGDKTGEERTYASIGFPAKMVGIDIDNLSILGEGYGNEMLDINFDGIMINIISIAFLSIVIISLKKRFIENTSFQRGLYFALAYSIVGFITGMTVYIWGETILHKLVFYPFILANMFFFQEEAYRISYALGAIIIFWIGYLISYIKMKKTKYKI
jgi:hypothetical protein